jgi:hypothetical protein
MGAAFSTNKTKITPASIKVEEVEKAYFESTGRPMIEKINPPFNPAMSEQIPRGNKFLTVGINQPGA